MAYPVRAVIFDVGGVIARQDTDEADAGYGSIDARLTAGRVNVARSGPLLYGAWLRYSVGDMTPDAYWAAVADALGVDADTRGQRLRRVHAATVWAVLDESVLALANRLKARGDVRLGVLSNSGPEYQAHVAPLGPTFDVLHFSHLTRRRKPDPAAYTALADDLGVEPAACVFIDDKLRNVVAARALGMAGIHFEDAVSLEHALLENGSLGGTGRRPR
jgi:putative hydrolase of the HAD superfamily